VSADRRNGFSIISLSPPSRILLSELRSQLEPRQAEDGDLRPFTDWVAKHPGRIATIAGLLHLAEHPAKQPVGEITMRKALGIGEYLLAHAIAALSMPNELDRRATCWLASCGKKVVTQREIHRGPPMNKRGTAAEAAELIQRLVDLDVLRGPYVAASGAQGGQRRSPAYAINPHLRRAARQEDAS
jgi:hypothetical protein